MGFRVKDEFMSKVPNKDPLRTVDTSNLPPEACETPSFDNYGTFSVSSHQYYLGPNVDLSKAPELYERSINKLYKPE